MRRFHRGLFIAGMLLLSVVACSKATTVASDDMSLGNPKAKVTVIEYASVACPICGRWFKEVYPAFKAKYIDTGRIHYVAREMLVGNGEEVSTAAAGFLLARCAGRDKYFSVTGAIFLSQPGLFDDPRGTLLRVAQSAGLSESAFNACITDEKALTALNQRAEHYGKDEHIEGTPTFVVNGKALETGFHSLADLDAAIAAAQAAK
ncbi:MAG TPA: thioredoxin domain-containing protein [Caulobacteraceae bacterium]